jgi:hypothetical protein
MENELLKECKPILARVNKLEKLEEPQLEQSAVKEIIRDVLQELKSRENLISKNRPRSNNE